MSCAVCIFNLSNKAACDMSYACGNKTDPAFKIRLKKLRDAINENAKTTKQ